MEQEIKYLNCLQCKNTPILATTSVLYDR